MMTVDMLLSEVMKLFDYLGLTTMVQVFIVIMLATAMLWRIFGRD